MGTNVTEIAPDVYGVGPWGFTQTNVYIVRTGPSWVLIDAGWSRDAPRIQHAARGLVGHVPPAAILLTHAHPDHSGAAGELARTWRCPVWMHPKELPIATGDFAAMQAWAGPLDRWVILPFMKAMGRRRQAATLARGSLADVARTFTPATEVPSLPGWEAIATPGHTPGHVSYLRRDDRVLISGDALCTLQIDSVRGLLLQRPGLSGPPWYTTWNPTATAQSMTKLVQLQPTVIAGGHGTPLTTTAATTALDHVNTSLRQASERRRRVRTPTSTPPKRNRYIASSDHCHVGCQRTDGCPPRCRRRLEGVCARWLMESTTSTFRWPTRQPRSPC